MSLQKKVKNKPEPELICYIKNLPPPPVYTPGVWFRVWLWMEAKLSIKIPFSLTLILMTLVADVINMSRASILLNGW